MCSILRTQTKFQRVVKKISHSSHTNKEPPSLILIEIQNEDTLLNAHQHIDSLGIDCAFFEPDDHLGYDPGDTAFATLPITQEQRHHLKKYRLYNELYTYIAQPTIASKSTKENSMIENTPVIQDRIHNNSLIRPEQWDADISF